MTKSLYLDPERLERYQPFEGDSRNGSWISPFGIPTYMQLRVDGDQGIRYIGFEYNGGETGDPAGRHTLDDQCDPEILIQAGRLSGKILEMTFARPIPFGDLATVAERLNREVENDPRLSKKFNYRMISDILKHWDEVVERAD